MFRKSIVFGQDANMSWIYAKKRYRISLEFVGREKEKVKIEKIV